MRVMNRNDISKCLQHAEMNWHTRKALVSSSIISSIEEMVLFVMGISLALTGACGLSEAVDRGLFRMT